MNLVERYFVIFYGIFSFLVFIKGNYEAIRKKNPYGLTPFLVWLGIFVWGDAVVLGLFWFLSSLTVYLLGDWSLFLLTISVFWVVRSFGEIIYWLNQQFLYPKNNYYEKLAGYHFFKSTAILFVYQVIWQCIAVVSIISTIYFVFMWLSY